MWCLCRSFSQWAKGKIVRASVTKPRTSGTSLHDVCVCLFCLLAAMKRQRVVLLAQAYSTMIIHLTGLTTACMLTIIDHFPHMRVM